MLKDSESRQMRMTAVEQCTVATSKRGTAASTAAALIAPACHKRIGLFKVSCLLGVVGSDVSSSDGHQLQ